MKHKSIRTKEEYNRYMDEYNQKIQDSISRGVTMDIRFGDCLDQMESIPSDSVDLIVTSPPYANARKNTYGGVPPDKFVEWFAPRSLEMKRILKPNGSLVINIDDIPLKGKMQLIDARLRIMLVDQQGWNQFHRPIMWYKTNCFPGFYARRLRHSYEPIFLFHKSPEAEYSFHKERLMKPMGSWHSKRMKCLNGNDLIRKNSDTKSGFGKNISHWLGAEMASANDVLVFSSVCHDKGHSAAFPDILPETFIHLLSDPGDLVVDPFAGSGTTCRVARNRGRNSIGIELVPNNTIVELSKSAMSEIRKAS